MNSSPLDIYWGWDKASCSGFSVTLLSQQGWKEPHTNDFSVAGARVSASSQVPHCAGLSRTQKPQSSSQTEKPTKHCWRMCIFDQLWPDMCVDILLEVVQKWNAVLPASHGYMQFLGHRPFIISPWIGKHLDKGTGHPEGHEMSPSTGTQHHSSPSSFHQHFLVNSVPQPS